MKIVILISLFCFNAYSQICSDSKLLIGNKCLGKSYDLQGIGEEEVLTKTDLVPYLGSRDQAALFCNHCKNNALDKILENKDAIASKKSAFGKGVLDEFQKELTFISMDLMKMRSSFSLSFDSSKAVKSCDFNSNLKRPKCLTPEQAQQFEAQTKSIKNALATELTIVLSDKTQGRDGLLIRRENACHISDTDATAAHIRFSESLLTPDFIASLKNLKVPPNSTWLDFMKDRKDGSEKEAISQLRFHPIFKSFLNNTSHLEAFLKEVVAGDNTQTIIEKLYAPKFSKMFGDDITSRCEQLFSKTSKYLDEIYCKKEPVYVADDAGSMESISGKRFILMNDQEAENEISSYCSYLNNASQKDISFTKIKNDINKMNDPAITLAPIKDFQANAHTKLVGDLAKQLCEVKLDPKHCIGTPTLPECAMYKFLELNKKSPEYLALYKSSSDNINLTLRALVGDGIPLQDGKPDSTAIALLKSEGILPGGDTSSRPPQQTAAAFNKTVNSAAAIPQPQQAAKPAPIAAPAKTEETQPSYAQSAARSADSDDEADSPSSHSDSPVKRKSQSKPKSKFSSLSDDEQQELMNRMKRSRKAGGKIPTTASNEEEEDSNEAFASTGDSMGNIAAQAAVAGSAVANAAQQVASAGAAAGKKAVLDPTKKSSSLNDAMVDANANRQLASSGLSSSGAQVSISKSAANENEIKIKVAEAELSQVNEFKEKLKVLLNAHSQEISVAAAGEKFVVKLNNFEINVVFNKQLGTYEALCKDASIPKDYLKTISNYFNVTLKGSSGKREALINTLKQ